MIKFGVETLADVYDELQPILLENYEELTFDKDLVKLDPDWDSYRQLDADGKLVIFTARDDAALIGYAFFFVSRHIHYKSLVVASNDVLFIKKEHRLGMVGVKFLKFCDSNLSMADKIVWHVKPTPDFSPILHRLGYKYEDTLMGRIR